MERAGEPNQLKIIPGIVLYLKLAMRNHCKIQLAPVFQSIGPKHTVDGRNPAQPCIVETL